MSFHKRKFDVDGVFMNYWRITNNRIAMALAINIEDLLNKQKIESNRIEFKNGWNPASIYHSVCAFANDFDDLGGGYILVGVDSDGAGMAIRPVEGVPIEKIDGILQDMVGCFISNFSASPPLPHQQATTSHRSVHLSLANGQPYAHSSATPP